MSRRAARRRCDARLKQNIRVDPKTGRVRTKGGRCRAWALVGKTRCRMLGGMSTGPKTDDGMERVVAAMVPGRRLWVEKLKAEGKKVPGGRKGGEAWYTPKMRAEAVDEARRLGVVIGPHELPGDVVRRLLQLRKRRLQLAPATAC